MKSAIFADTGGSHFGLPISRGVKFRSGLDLTPFLRVKGYPQMLNALSRNGFRDFFLGGLAEAKAEMLY